MKWTKNYLKYIRIEVWIFILVIGLITLNEGIGIKGFNEISFNRNFASNSGNFSLENTSEKTNAFNLLETPLIGQIWNVSISLLGNSTSGINCSVSSDWANIWEGPTQFGVQIGKNIRVQYILHACGDLYDHFRLNFYFKLHNSSAYAQGSYSAKIHFYGYALPPECNTGQLYVSNITKWLNPKSNTTNISYSKDIVIIGLMIMLFQRRRRYRKRYQKE